VPARLTKLAGALQEWCEVIDKKGEDAQHGRKRGLEGPRALSMTRQTEIEHVPGYVLQP